MRGGGAGGGINATGTTSATTRIISVAGGTSSFGNYVTALGGGGSSYNVRSAQGSRRGVTKVSSAATSSSGVGTSALCYGAAGWMPGIGFLPPTTHELGFTGPINGVGAGTLTAADSYTYAGSGYGAGGGACALGAYTWGSNYVLSGNAGEIIFANCILSSAAQVIVTVGTGGAAYTTNASITEYAKYASNGADGCVAVFW